MAFVVVYDSSVLQGALGNLLLRLAAGRGQGTSLLAGATFHARWTGEIINECLEALARHRPDLGRATLRRFFARMNDGVDLVTGYEHLISAIQLPRPDRRHVLAAAIRCGAQAIVTRTPHDFPQEALQRYGDLETLHPDVFVINQIDQDSSNVWSTCQELAAASIHNRSISKVLDLLERDGLVATVAVLRQFSALQERVEPEPEGDPGSTEGFVGR
jgi:hypothetical protein